MELLQQPWEIKYSSYITCEMVYHSKVVCGRLKTYSINPKPTTRKHTWQNLTSIPVKNSQKARNRRKLSQSDI